MHLTVIKYKGKIKETIARLDKYKLEALTKAWQTVNGEFGQIFDTLLPGNWCELQPAEGMALSQGLEVRVRLGSTWKSSLTELSGGQRLVEKRERERQIEFKLFNRFRNG
ncbi:hypothetical protein BY996DRAFT_4582788 [Phakopsora pachyrhizi]|nr:hypothetical protein BY996DRAFT_4582788 [Phakopsora pachyrhizi]